MMTLTPKAVQQAGHSIQTAIDLTESQFLEIGKRLETVIAILSRLTDRFGRLKDELDGEAIRDAARGLSAAAQISSIATTRQGERQKLDNLHRLSDRIDARVAEMRTEMKTIDVLTMNARIATAAIGAAGMDFLDYMNEIAPSLKLTQAHLEQFEVDLGQAEAQLAAARAGEAEFDKRYASTVGSIAERLERSVALIGTRRRGAATAAMAIEGKSQQVSRGIANAVMALQVGDATRQRLEHAQLAARLVAQVLAPEANGQQQPWRALTEQRRRQLAATGCRLQAAQLDDVASELEREIASVLTALRQLAGNAGEIVRLSNDTYGSTGRGANPFLRELEADVGEAQALFEGFRTARTKADQVMSSVLDVAGRLSEHIVTVQSLETDIRVVGFNTTFKCGRLGERGLALKVIAQELRACSGRTAIAANAITADVREITTIASALCGEDQGNRPEQIAAVTASMTESLTLMRSVGESLAAALESLAQDGAKVATLLDETLARMNSHGEIVDSVRAVAETFAELGRSIPLEDESQDGAGEELWAELAASYTMARERDIHAMVLHGAAGAAMAAAQPAETASLDDILF